MRYILVSNRKPINIGRQGEESVTTVRFSINAFFPHMPSGATYGLIHQRHGDAAPYPCTIEVVDGYINWVIGSGDLANVGSGTAQLSAYLNGAVAKTVIFTTVTTNSMGATNPPDPQQIWIDNVINAGTRAEQAAAEAEEIRDSIEPEIVWVTYRQPTSAELDALYQAGKLVAFKSSVTGCIYFLTKRVSATFHEFTATNEAVLRCVRVVDDVWYDTDVYTFATEGYVSSYVGSKASNNTPADLAVTPYAGGSLDFSRSDHVHKMPSAEDIGAYVKPSGGIPASDLASGVIPEAEVFWAIYGTTTNAEIEAAHQAGKIVMCLYNSSYVLCLTYRPSANRHRFSAVTSGGSLFWAACENNSWTHGSEILAPANSPYLTGTPKAPTAASGTNTTQIATTAFVQQALASSGSVDGVFWATYGTTTYAELNAAYEAGKILACKRVDPYGVTNQIFTFVERTPYDNTFRFACVCPTGIYYLTCNSATWSESNFELPSTAGTYALNVVNNGGVRTYSWVAQS